MNIVKFLVLPVFLILFTSSFAPFVTASEASEAQEDIDAGCRDGQTMVYRMAYKDYVCVEPSTAERWAELGLAEILDETINIETEDEPEEESTSENYGAPPPPPPPKVEDVTVESQECRPGYTLVYQIRHHETLCINTETALKWEQLGLVTIVEEGVDIETSMEEEFEIEERDEERYEEFEDERDEDDEREVENEIVKEKPKPISTKGISLPNYPNQPAIHPRLEASNEFWEPPTVYQVNERVWVAVGYDFANSIMIEGDTGIIIVDTLSTYEAAKEVLGEFRKITEKPVKAIIYTHGHLDHVHGTKAFLEEGDGAVEIIAHESLLDFYINENSVLGPIASVRSSYATGTFLPDEGDDRYNMGIFPKGEPGTIAFVPPTHTFSNEFSLDISGVKMKLVHVAGESSDQLYVWLPEDEVLLIGDNIYAIFPNIYTLRGAVYRDPMNYVNALDKMIPLGAEHLVPSHVKPISGKENVLDVLISTRDATQYVYDQTIRGMNQGYTADELSHMITLPEWFDEHPWITESRGQIPWHVKQIYFGNLGWYQGDPAFLLPISDAERAEKIVDGFGGVDRTIGEINKAIDNEEYSWAAELATYVIDVEPENTKAKLLKAFALRVLGQQMLSADGRHWAITKALELEGKITIDPHAFTQTSPEQLAELPVEKVLRSLPTKIDPEKLEETDTKLSIYYSDLEKGFTLHFRNGILAVLDGEDETANHSIVLDSQTHKLIVSGQLSLVDGIESGQVEFDGDVPEIEEMMEFFEPFSIHAEGVRG